MKRKPRSMDKKLFNREAAFVSFLQGAVVLVIVALIFVSSINRGLGDQTARTMPFATIVVANLTLILKNRSWVHTLVGTFRKRNNAFWWILGLALLALALVIYVPQLSGLFRFTALQPTDFYFCVGEGLASIVWFELYKVAKKSVNSKHQT